MSNHTSDWRSHLVAYLFALQFFFGYVLIANALELHFFYYFPRHIHIIVLDPGTDILVWGLSSVFLCFLLIWTWKDLRREIFHVGLAGLATGLVMYLLWNPNKAIVYLLFVISLIEFVSIALHYRLEKSAACFASRVFIYFLVFFITIEISSGIHYVLKSFDPQTHLGHMDAEIELQLSYASYGVLPWLYFAFLFSWVWVPFVQRLTQNIGAFKLNEKSASENHPAGVTQRTYLKKRFSKLFYPSLLLVLAIMAFIGYYPYFHNPPWLVGTDALWRYYDPLIRMNDKGVAGGFAQAVGERHPLTLMLLYATQLLSHTTAFEIVRLTPLFLVIGLSLSTWWFLAGKDMSQKISLILLLSTMSLTTTVGVYASILSNWLALVVWMCFFAYVTSRSDQKLRASDAILLLVMSSLVLWIHPWSWGVFALSLVLVGLVTLFHERLKGLRIGVLLVSIVATGLLLAFLSVALLGGSQGWRISETIGYYTVALKDPTSVLVFWGVMTRLTQIWAPFFSPLLIVASILGVFSLSRLDQPMRRRLIFAWICAVAIGSILVAPVGYDVNDPLRSEPQIWRLFYLTPFQLTVPFGIALIAGFPRKWRTTNRHVFQESSQTICGILFAGLAIASLLITWLPVQMRPILFLAVLPTITGLAISKTDEVELLSNIITVSFVLVAFNHTTRALSQLLIDPHNYTPP